MQIKNQYYERVYKNHPIAVFKRWCDNNWYMYLDKKYVHNMTFESKKSAFEYLKSCVDNA